MPRQKNLLTVIRELVRTEVAQALQGLLGGLTGSRPKAKNGRRRKRRGPGRPPGSKNKKRRGPGRPRGSKNKPV